VLSLVPAPPGSETAVHLPSKDLSGPSPAAPAAPEPEAPEALPADDLAPREDVTT
jgi:hypothetical protein